MDRIHQRIRDVASAHSVSVSALEGAASLSAEIQTGLTKRLGGVKAQFPCGLDVVVFGSLARGEVTKASDCDYLVLLDDLDAVPHSVTYLNAMAAAVLDEGLAKPGPTGIFGTFTSATEMVGRIGLESDSNLTTTRRVLLLSESTSVLEPAIREKAVQALISRYCDDYRVVTSATLPTHSVPRFLMNDLTRYWRTITVDFGAKRWNAGSSGQHLRRAKLLTTRKVLFAGSVAAAFRPELLGVQPDDKPQIEEVLKEEFAVSPLARLMGLDEFLTASGKDALSRVLAEYEHFLSLSSDKREEIERLDSLPDPDLTAELTTITTTIQAALEEVFLDNPISPMTRRYLLF